MSVSDLSGNEVTIERLREMIARHEERAEATEKWSHLADDKWPWVQTIAYHRERAAALRELIVLRQAIGKDPSVWVHFRTVQSYVPSGGLHLEGRIAAARQKEAERE